MDRPNPDFIRAKRMVRTQDPWLYAAITVFIKTTEKPAILIRQLAALIYKQLDR